MEVKLTLDIDALTISELAAETETNHSVFIRDFCKNILKKISSETKNIYKNIRKINIENPFGFPYEEICSEDTNKKR